MPAINTESRPAPPARHAVGGPHRAIRGRHPEVKYIDIQPSASESGAGGSDGVPVTATKGETHTHPLGG